MGGRSAEKGHELIAVGVHVHLIDDAVVAVNHRLGAAVVGVKHRSGAGGVGVELLKNSAKIVKIGEEDAHRAKLTQADLGSVQEAAGQTAYQIGAQCGQPSGESDQGRQVVRAVQINQIRRWRGQGKEQQLFNALKPGGAWFQVGTHKQGGSLIRDHHLAGGGDLLGHRHPVDLGSGDDQFDMALIAHLGGEDTTTVDTNAQAQGEGTGASLQTDKLAHAPLHRQGSGGGSRGMGSTNSLCIKKCSDRIATKLEQGTLMGVDLGDQRGEEPVHHRTHLLGPLATENTETLGECRETGEIGEEQAAIPESTTRMAGARVIELGAHQTSGDIGGAGGEVGPQISRQPRPVGGEQIAPVG